MQLSIHINNFKDVEKEGVSIAESPWIEALGGPGTPGFWSQPFHSQSVGPECVYSFLEFTPLTLIFLFALW